MSPVNNTYKYYKVTGQTDNRRKCKHKNTNTRHPATITLYTLSVIRTNLTSLQFHTCIQHTHTHTSKDIKLIMHRQLSFCLQALKTFTRINSTYLAKHTLMLPALIIIILCGLLGLKHQLTNYDVASPGRILCGLLGLKHQLTNYDAASPDRILCGLLGLKHQLTNYDVAHHYVLIEPSQSSRTYDFVSPQWGAADA